MRGKEKQKICHQCDGRLPLDADECIFCGSKVSEAKVVEKEMLYKPPYPSRIAAQEAVSSGFRTVTASSATGLEHYQNYQEKKEAETNQELETEVRTSLWKHPVLWGTFLLLLASHSLILGISLLCFSQNGVLTLSWKMQYWYVYALLALPLVYLGWRLLDKEEED